ncbi:General amino acid permease AGP2 [Fusarium oxysporum f. sp. albedinis]|nr:General amino acid permease AGP2 [Fusarium oxysporum f. sp. albedinis]
MQGCRQIEYGISGQSFMYEDAEPKYYPQPVRQHRNLSSPHATITVISRVEVRLPRNKVGERLRCWEPNAVRQMYDLLLRGGVLSHQVACYFHVLVGTITTSNE